jgi:hypothetical protein
LRRDHSKELFAVGMIILKWILDTQHMLVWKGCVLWCRIGFIVRIIKHSNESSRSMEGGEFLDQLSDC